MLKKCTEKKTGVEVAAWTEDYKFLGNIDIADLKPGYQVRELGGLLKITDTLHEDEDDYMIPVEGAYMSPLLLITEPERNEPAREIFKPVKDLIYEICEQGYSPELFGKLLREADNAWNKL